MDYNYNDVNQSHMSKEMVSLMLNNLIKEANDSENANNLIVKAEPVEEDFEIENNQLESLRNTYVNGIKLEPDVTEQMESVEVFENSIFGRPYCKVANTVAGVKQELEEIVPMESLKVLENVKLDHSYCMVLNTASFKSKQFSSNSLTKSDIVKLPGVVYDDWKIKNEEVDLKQEVMLEELASLPSGLSEQEECDDSNKHKDPEELNLFKCDKCEYRTHLKFWFKQHVLRHQSLKKVRLFRCNKCKFQSRFKSSLKLHLFKHQSAEKVDFLRCDKCKFETLYKSSLKDHLLRHQSNEDLFRCDKCKYVPVPVISIILRTTFILFKCDKCEFVTRCKKSLMVHSLRHKDPEEVNLFKCDKCEYRTRDKSNLKGHVLRHQFF